jgi:hypothetical protein
MLLIKNLLTSNERYSIFRGRCLETYLISGPFGSNGWFSGSIVLALSKYVTIFFSFVSLYRERCRRRRRCTAFRYAAHRMCNCGLMSKTVQSLSKLSSFPVNSNWASNKYKSYITIIGSYEDLLGTARNSWLTWVQPVGSSDGSTCVWLIIYLNIYNIQYGWEKISGTTHFRLDIKPNCRTFDNLLLLVNALNYGRHSVHGCYVT